MEDLTGNGRVISIYDGLSVKQIKSLVVELAQLHAYILTLENDGWKDKFSLNYWSIDFDKAFSAWFSTALEMDREHLEIPFRRLIKLRKAEFSTFAFVDYAKRIGLPDMLCHGDFWTNNVMFDSGDPSRVRASLDPAMAFNGSLAVDMAMMISSSTEPDVRRELEQFIVDFYYDTLTKLMKERGKSLNFNVEQVRLAYKIASAGCALINVIVAPMYNELDASIKGSPEEWTYRKAKLLARGRASVDDAIEILKDIAPEWLED